MITNNLEVLCTFSCEEFIFLTIFMWIFMKLFREISILDILGELKFYIWTFKLAQFTRNRFFYKVICMWTSGKSKLWVSERVTTS